MSLSLYIYICLCHIKEYFENRKPGEIFTIICVYADTEDGFTIKKNRCNHHACTLSS